ncbi:MAG: oligoendopeptidase F, partial [Ilumatobacteraceae bacterium]
MTDTSLPTWSVTDVHESLSSRSFVDAMERIGAQVHRLESLFDELDIRATDDVRVDPETGRRVDRAVMAFNETVADLEVLEAYVYATVSTDSRDETAQSSLSELDVLGSRVAPLLARLADFVDDHGVDALASVSDEARDHHGPLTRLAARSAHQMSEVEEGLYAELSTTGSSAWGRLQADVTSQLSIDVELPSGRTRLPMPAVRGLASDADPFVRRAAYDAEMIAWPSVATACAAAMNAIKGEANTVNRRRQWDAPIDASLYANSVSRATFEAMQSAVTASLPAFRTWMRTKASLHGHTDGLPWWDLVAPLPVSARTVTWDDSIDLVRSAFSEFSSSLGNLVDRAVSESWIDAPPREGKVGGAFCMPFVDD